MKPEYNVSLSKIAFVCIAAIILLAFSTQSYAATCTHYASPTGSATWANATNINTPTDIQTAFNSAVAGNVVCFRGGTYNFTYNPPSDYNQQQLQPANSGTSSSWITFQAYPSEVPLVNIIGTDSTGTFAGYVSSAMGVYHQNYIILDGFHLTCDGGVHRPRVHIGDNAEYFPPHSTANIIIRNFDINGGSAILPALGDNSELIRLDSAGYVTIQSNKLYNSRTSDNGHNTSAIKTYNTDHTIVQNNEIYNNSNGVYFKRDCEQCTISYNYIHNNYIGSLHAVYNNFSMPDTHIFHNVYAHHGYIAISMDNDQSGGASADNWQIYNNTIYDSAINGVAFEGSSTAANGATIYNNITQLIGGGDELSGTGTSGLVAEDHNQWGTSSFRITINQYQGNQIQSSSLAAWQATTALASGGHPGASDLVSNPLFTNGSGNYSLLSDFTLQANSPCKGAGRGGVDIGANVYLVGLSADGKIPSPPSNLR